MTIEISERLHHADRVDATLTLPFELRQRSRLKASLDNGQPIGLFLRRGNILRHGDLLRAENGLVVRVEAAPEDVSTARADNPWLLAKASYHLGNRHIALEVGHGWVRFLHDHVLDSLVRDLGLSVTREQAPFEPEAGAYDHATAHGHTHVGNE